MHIPHGDRYGVLCYVKTNGSLLLPPHFDLDVVISDFKISNKDGRFNFEV
jgi:hypothetical protein